MNAIKNIHIFFLIGEELHHQLTINDFERTILQKWLNRLQSEHNKGSAMAKLLGRLGLNGETDAGTFRKSLKEDSLSLMQFMYARMTRDESEAYEKLCSLRELVGISVANDYPVWVESTAFNLLK